MTTAVTEPKNIPRYCAILAGGIGAVGLAGWIFDISALQRIHPALVTMKANTAIALVLASLSLLLLQEEKVTRGKRRSAQLLAAVITVSGLLTLGEYLFGWDLGIDQFFFRESPAAAGQSFPGRMGLASTVVFICLGTALLVLDVRLAGRYWATKLASVAGLATTLVFLYYFFGIEQGEAVPRHASIALLTVVAFHALCVGIFFARPGRGVLLELLGPSVGGVVARRMLPAAFFLPILLGWIMILGERADLFGQGFGAAAFVVLIILVFTGLIRTTVIAVNRQEAERERTEVALRRSEANLRDFVDNATVGLHWVGPDGIILWANQAELNLLGYTGEEYIGHSVSEFHADAPVIEDILARLTKGESLNECPARLRCKDGSIRHVLIDSNVLFEDGRFVHTRCITRDITEGKRAETALRESEERFRALADSALDAIITMDHEGKVMSFNPAAERTFGFRSEDVVGQTLAEKIIPERLRERHHQGLAHYLASGEGPVLSRRIEVPALHADGHEFDIELSINRIAGIEPPLFTATMRDITERQEADEALHNALEEAQRSARAKDDFLAALSHELRTPLTPVLMMATALGDDPALPPEVREQLAMMRRNIELEARLIDDLLDLTRISSGKLTIAPAVTDVHELLDHTAEIVLSERLGKDVSIVFTQQAVRHHALADPARLQQVFWNLIKNAIKFTPSGGSITVSTRSDAEDKIILSVADSGVGISAEALPHIFNAFEQGDVAGQHRYGGLGLGLAISKAIMVAHGGTISVESAGQDRGATFTAILASTEAPTTGAGATASAGASAGAGAGAGAGLRLLVVEDHESTRTVLAKLLTSRGHRVTTASTVQEALSAYAAGQFDAVISDLGLPDGRGLDLMREIQRLRPVPAIALSGYGMEDDVRQTKEAGFFAHLVKPVNVDQLRQLIDQIEPGSHFDRDV